MYLDGRWRALEALTKLNMLSSGTEEYINGVLVGHIYRQKHPSDRLNTVYQPREATPGRLDAATSKAPKQRHHPA